MTARVGPGREAHLKVPLSVGAKSGYHAAALLYREAGTERRVAGHLGLADGLHGATDDYADESGVGRDRYGKIAATGDPESENEGEEGCRTDGCRTASAA